MTASPTLHKETEVRLQRLQEELVKADRQWHRFPCQPIRRYLAIKIRALEDELERLGR